MPFTSLCGWRMRLAHIERCETVRSMIYSTPVRGWWLLLTSEELAARHARRLVWRSVAREPYVSRSDCLYSTETHSFPMGSCKRHHGLRFPQARQVPGTSFRAPSCMGVVWTCARFFRRSPLSSEQPALLSSYLCSRPCRAVICRCMPGSCGPLHSALPQSGQLWWGIFWQSFGCPRGLSPV